MRDPNGSIDDSNKSSREPERIRSAIDNLLTLLARAVARQLYDEQRTDRNRQVSDDDER